MKSLYSMKGKRVWVAGHKGMVGSAVVRRLQDEDCDVLVADRSELDLCDASAVAMWVRSMKPDAVIVAAAKVGGIHANTVMPVDFIADNLSIANNVIRQAYENNVEKLLFLGSSCIYPREAEQPIKESSLLTGPLEPTNEWYAIAKIAGIKLCQAYRKQYGSDFISAMPTNLYGPNDNFHPENSHVPAALLSRFHDAKKDDLSAVEVWGSGRPRREFLYVDDLADACIFLMKNYSEAEHVNVGCDEDVTISDFARQIKEVVGFEGKIIFDTQRPDGMLLKKLDVSKMNALGWASKVDLATGLKNYYDWFSANQNHIKK